jgi:hypothetical protein
MFRISIKSRCCLVEENHLGVTHQCTSNGHALLLTTRESHSFFTDLGVVAFGENFFVLNKVEAEGFFASVIEEIIDFLNTFALEIYSIKDVISDTV